MAPGENEFDTPVVDRKIQYLKCITKSLTFMSWEQKNVGIKSI